MYTEFRGPGEWEGEYDDVGKVVGKLDVGRDLQYHIVISKQPDEGNGDWLDVFFLIPVTWIDWEGKRFLYPGPDYHVNGLSPWEWRDISYRRRRHPESSWMEYDIAEFLNENPVSFNEAQEESSKLEKSVKHGALQNSKIRRQQVTEADNNIGLSRDISFTSQGDKETFPSTRMVGSPLPTPSTSYVGQSPGFHPSAQSSPQSVKSYTPRRDAAMPSNDLSAGLSYTPRRDASISLNNLSLELPETSRFSSERDIRSSNRGGFQRMTPSSRVRRVSKGSNRSGFYASSPSLADINELEDQLDGSGSSLMNPPFRPNPISAKKSVNPARTGANLTTNLTGQVNAASNQGRRDAHQGKGYAHQGRRDAHPDRRDAHPDRRDAHPDRRDSHPDRRDSHPDRRDSHPDRRDAHPDRRDAHPDRRDAHPDRRDAHPDRRDAHPASRDVHPDRRDPIQKAAIPGRTDTTLAKVDANPLDGNQKNSLSSAQNGSDPHPGETAIGHTEVNKDGNANKSFQGIVINFCSSALKLLKDLVDPKLTKERVINDNYEHFRTVVNDNLTLPLTDPENVPVLNNALLDMRLSVSLCCVQIRALRSLNSKDKIAKELMRRLFSDGLCRQITWKERRADRRQAYGHLVNVVAVFCVVIQHIMELNKMEPVPLSSLVSTIQNARRLVATAHKQKGTTVAAATNEDGDGLDGASPCDRHLILQFDSRIAEINTAISNYVP